MITTNLPTLKINKLTQEQYDRELAAGNINENELYLTPYDTGWTTLTLGTGVTSSRPLSCRKIGNVVYIHGAIALTDLTTSYTTIASGIPEGQRPKDGNHLVLCPTSGTTLGRIAISTDGVITLQWIQPIEATYTYSEGSLDIDYNQVTGDVSWVYIDTSYVVD